MNLGIAHASAGSLTGSSAPSPTIIDLTREGTADWAHWGANQLDDFGYDHKATGGSQISNYTPIGAIPRTSYAYVGYSWTDGMPTSSISNSRTSLISLAFHNNNGFSFTAPADTSTRTLMAFVGADQCSGTFTAHLSDGSAVDYIETSAGFSGSNEQVITLTYRAAAPGQTLTVTWTVSADNNISAGGVTLEAATLSLGQPPTDFNLSANPGDVSIQQGSSGTNAITVNPAFGFTGAVNLAVTGLPAGVTAAFSPNPTAGGSVMTLSAANTAAVGTSALTVTGTSGGISHTLGMNLSVTRLIVTVPGTLSGSSAPTSGTVNLTTEGTADWAHWGTASAASFDRKASVLRQISNYTAIGPPANSYGNSGINYSWTDGATTPTIAATTTGLYTSGVGNGFTFTVLADTAVRTLKVYVGGYQCAGTLTAHLSDGSAVDFTGTASNTATSFNQTFTLTYSAGSIGDNSLTVTWTQTSGTGNVALQSAAVSYVTAPPPDFRIATTLSGIYFPTQMNVSVTRYNGFTNHVNLGGECGSAFGDTLTFSPALASNSSVAVFLPQEHYPDLQPVTGYTGGIDEWLSQQLDHAYTISGVSGDINHSLSGNVNISPAPDFLIGVPTLSYRSHLVRGKTLSTSFFLFTVGQCASPITLSAVGLPHGVTATFSPNPAVPGNGVSVDLTAASDATLGPFLLSISGTGAGITHRIDAESAVTVVAPGALTWSAVATTTPVNLTALGTSDWAHWGLGSDVNGLYHKAGVVPLINVLGGASYPSINPNPIGYTWTDGTPSASATGTQTALFSQGYGTDVTLNIMADTITPRTLQVFVGGYHSEGHLTAHLTDDSAPDVVYQVSSLDGYNRTVTLAFQAGWPGQQLVVTWGMVINGPADGNNVSFQSAALELGIPTPDFDLSTYNSGDNAFNMDDPNFAFVRKGSPCSLQGRISPINGFSGAVHLSVSGLPPGVAATFNPDVTTGLFPLSFNVYTNAPAGPAPITITATSGNLTHSMQILLVITPADPYFSYVSVSPYPVSLVPHGTQQFSATAMDQYGLPMSTQPAFTWSTSGGGSIDPATGLFTAGPAGGGPFTVTATSGLLYGKTFVIVAADQPGALSGSGAATVQPINLTAVGTSDWAHWGTTSATSFDHKATGGTQISNYIPVGPPASSYPSNGINYSWTDGMPTATMAATPSGLYTSGTNNGYSIMVPADGNVRTLKVYVGGYQSTGTLTAHLVDGSAADFVATASNLTTSYNQTFTLTYTSGTANDYLLVTWIQTDGPGNVTLQSAALIAGALTPDFSLSATPVSVARGGGGASTITVNPVFGFNSGVTLSASGLPTGVTAAFGTNPATGTSVLTFSASATAALGPATVTITGTSGALTHTATVNLTVTPAPDFSLSATPTNVSFVRGGGGASTITVNPLYGFNSGVTLSASGLPNGVTAVFGTNPATGTSVLTFSASATAALGQATVTITGASGALTHSATVNLTVTPQPVLTTITVNPASATIKTGTAQPFTALGKDQYGNPLSPQPAFTWSVSGGGAINASTGLFRAGNAIGGPFAVTAASGSISGTATVSVVYNPLIDFNGDGSADIVLQNAGTSQIDLWYMSDLTLLGGMHVSSLPGIGWNVVGQGDFNGDGKADLVLQNASTGRVALWYMNGGVLVSGQYISAIPPAGWTVTAVGDFNGDGKPDLVLQNSASRQIAVWCMNNTVLTSGQYVSAIPGAGWNLAGVGDFNGDGKPDLVLQNATSGQVALWYLNGVTVTGGQYASATPGAGWHVSGVGDFNGDGKADLVLQNASSNQIAIWHMSGSTVLSGLYVSVAPATGLTVVGPE